MKFPNYQKKEQNSTFRKTEYLRTTPGIHTVRLIPPIHQEFTHYVRGTTIACLGNECPICANNRKIIAENPDNYSDIPGYSYARDTSYVNVLDRTLAKICPECGNVIKDDSNGNMTSTCPSCNTVLDAVEVAPANQIKVLSRGVELFRDQLRVLDKAKKNEDGEPIGIENYDIDLTVGESKRPTASARLDRVDTIEYNEEDLFDLENAVIRLEVDEVNELLRGVSLKDIFASRRAEALSQEESDIPFDMEEEIQDAVDSLFDG